MSKYRIVKGYYGYHPQIEMIDDWYNIEAVNYYHTCEPFAFKLHRKEGDENNYYSLEDAQEVIEEYKESLQEVEVVWEGE